MDKELLLTKKPIALPKYEIVSDTDLVSKLHEHQARTFKLASQVYNSCLAKANPYEKIGNGSFLKLAFLDSTQEKIVDTSLDPFYFADLCGGSGGCSDYILRKNKNAKGFMLAQKSPTNLKR